MRRPPAVRPSLPLHVPEPPDPGDAHPDGYGITYKCAPQRLPDGYACCMEGWGKCRNQDWPGPVGECGQEIGTIGYRLSGQILCFACWKASKCSKTVL